MSKPLTVTISAPVAALVRDNAQAQGVTYESLVEACVRQCCANGGPIVLEPFGVREYAGANTRSAMLATS